MPLNPSGGTGATTPSTYYNANNNLSLGNYQFISLSEIIGNFIATYVGEGKILSTVLAGDVKFHAHRALQELSYDTLKSCKSQEIEVCPSLIMPLPHDYVNYVKLTSVDANGIEHPLYPNRNTSHPFAISQNNCEYEFNTDGTIKHQETCESGVETTCDATAVNNYMAFFENNDKFPVNPIIDGTVYDGSVQIVDSKTAEAIAIALINDHCQCLASASNIVGSPNCGILDCNLTKPTKGKGSTDNPTGKLNTGGNSYGSDIPTNGGPILTSQGTATSIKELCWTGLNKYVSKSGTAINIRSAATTKDKSIWTLPSYGPFTTAGECTPTSNAWTNFSTNSNGTYFIDCMRGNIHFSSDLSGQTIILKYISDGHGTDDEEIVPKLAEEAMYKWIAYGCLSARVDTPEYVIARFKKEKASETRKAKIRLSNIKIEEISQVFRGKSKWIKH